MSQILASPKSSNVIFQDLYFVRKQSVVETSVKEAICEVCKKGLSDGLSITAMSSNTKTLFYCSNHFLK